jgi:outer membrane scaffolding protein for murein synthesis (MipA/OmpV family)
VKALISIVLLFFTACVLHAEQLSDLPKWELGVGLSSFSLPDYPGADQRSQYILPFPNVIYRGERLKANREGMRGLLFENPRWDLDISAGGSLPVNSDDNRAREGMEDLDFSFELGPSLRLKLQDSELRKIQLRFNLRALLAVDGFPGIRYEGWVFNPELRWSQYLGDNLQLGASLQGRYGSSDYHHYFYGVTSQFATADRPAYQAREGYSSVGVGLFARWSINRDWRAGASFSYVDLNNAEFADSPLFKKSHSSYFGFSVSRILWRSAERTSETTQDD